MSEVAVIDPPVIEVTIAPVPHDMTLIARDPHQLQAEQRRLISWCDAKITEVQAATAELDVSIEHNRKHKWGIGPLQSARRREVQREQFYVKVREALLAGFYIVPNFPCDIFAIRTDQRASGEAQDSSQWRVSRSRALIQRAEVLDVGDGQYRSPIAKIETREEDEPKAGGKAGEMVTTYHAEAVDYRTMEFPFAFAKPEVLNATQQAMALRIFDELCVLPASKKKNIDPMIVGRIIRPWKRTGWNTDSTGERHISFLIVWWLDTKTI